MYNKRIDIDFDKLTIRQLRTMLFEFYNQDKPIVDTLFKMADAKSNINDASQLNIARYLLNFLFNQELICKVCNEECTHLTIDEDENSIEFRHDEEHGYNDVCVYLLNDEERNNENV